MSILKSRINFPPGGWVFFEPLTKWTAPYPTSDTFDETVKRIIAHRKLNPQHKLATDYDTVSNQLEVYTAHRLKFSPDWVLSGEAQKKTRSQVLPTILQNGPATLVQRLKQLLKQGKVGKATLSEWLGEGGLPVSKPRAQSRASICETCPKNVKGDFFDLIKGEIADAVKSQVETKNNLELTLDNEANLGTCEVCGCHLGLKPWVPMKHIKNHMDQDEFQELPDFCWIKTEKDPLLLVVIPYCNSDFIQAERLLHWINELGGAKDNPCLLVADIKVAPERQGILTALATKAFGSVSTITTPYSLPNEQWPLGPNWMFQTALRHVHETIQLPFLWLEPDSAPLKSGWITALENEYFSSGKPFMGAIVHSSGLEALPGDHMTGVGIYPPDAHEILKGTFSDRRAFDMTMAPIVVPQCQHSDLFQHFWGQVGLSPVFKKDASKENPVNTLLMRTIRKDAVMFHRCKNSSLIDLLRATK